MYSKVNPVKPAKGQMKCYHCRKQVANKDGEWLNWNQMQVFLCKPCDVQTKTTPERTGK